MNNIDPGSTNFDSSAVFLLDLLNDNDRDPTANRFDLSDVRLEDLRINDIDDLDEETHLHENNVTRNKSGMEFRVDGLTISGDLYDGKDTLDEDYFLEEEISPAPKLSRYSRKFTIASDIEEVDEEIEGEERFSSDYFQPSEILETSAYNKEIRDTKVRRTKSKLIENNASMLEHRLKMIASLKGQLEDQKMLKMKNIYLNRKCCKFLEKSTAVGPFESIKGALPIHEDQRYQNVLEDFMVMKSHYETAKPLLEDANEKLTNNYENFRSTFAQVLDDLVRREVEIGSNCIVGNTGKLLTGQKIHHLTKKQREKFHQLSKVRVSYLKLNNNLSFVNMKLQRLNKLGEGHTLMDYEQLMIMKHSLLDKIDERDEELRKYREKCTEYISILSHMKESSDVMSCDITNAHSKLGKATRMKKSARSSLVLEGLKRDSVRKNTSRIRHAAGLLENPMLLKKMNDDSRALEVLKFRVKKLENDPIAMNMDNVPITEGNM